MHRLEQEYLCEQVGLDHNSFENNAAMHCTHNSGSSKTALARKIINSQSKVIFVWPVSVFDKHVNKIIIIIYNVDQQSCLY